MNQNEIYQSITDTIINALESNTESPLWQQQWKIFAGNNHKSISKRPYQGVNQLICGIVANSSNYNCKTWATYNQWNKLGHKIKKGEKGTKIIKVLKIAKEEKDKITDKKITKTFSTMKQFVVFNGDQTESYHEQQVAIPKQNWDISDFEMIDNRAKELGAKIVEGKNSCYFNPTENYIGMPFKFQYEKAEHYYATFLHELTHWTDNPNRSPREEKIAKLLGGGKRFHPENYAFEELVAEIGSAFLLSHYNLSSDAQMREDHIPYIKSWISALKNDNKLIVKASSYAQQACNFITGITHQLEKGEENELVNAG